jgi:hypothetical protein
MAAMYFASIELKEIDFFFRLNQKTSPEPKPKQHPEVLFLSVAHHAQSESV